MSLAAGVMGRARSVGWGVADQAVSSLSNFVVNIYVARLLGAEQYGTFGVVFVTYAFALNASRGLASDPLMIRFSHTDQSTWRRAAARCTGTSLCVGLALGVVVLVAAAVLGGRLGLALLALAITLPGLLLQDGWRFAFFSCDRGAQAFLNDLTWLAIVIPLLIGLQVTHTSSDFSCVLAWGGAATAASALGVLQARVRPRLQDARRWLSQHRDLGFRYMVEGTSFSASTQLRTYGIGLFLGLAAVGYVQAANTLMAAVVVLVNGTGLVFLPQATRIWHGTSDHLVRFCARVSICYVALVVAWTLFLLIALPAGLGQLALGSLWKPTYPLVIPTALSVLGYGIAGGAGIGLKATGAARQSVRAALATNVMFVLFSLSGAVAGGAFGAVLGSAVAMWCGAIVYWLQFMEGRRQSTPTAVPQTTTPAPG